MTSACRRRRHHGSDGRRRRSRRRQIEHPARRGPSEPLARPMERTVMGIAAEECLPKRNLLLREKTVVRVGEVDRASVQPFRAVP